MTEGGACVQRLHGWPILVANSFRAPVSKAGITTRVFCRVIHSGRSKRQHGCGSLLQQCDRLHGPLLAHPLLEHIYADCSLAHRFSQGQPMQSAALELLAITSVWLITASACST